MCLSCIFQQPASPLFFVPLCNIYTSIYLTKTKNNKFLYRFLIISPIQGLLEIFSMEYYLELEALGSNKREFFSFIRKCLTA